MADFIEILFKNLFSLIAAFVIVAVGVLLIVWGYEIVGKGFEPVIGLFLFAMPFGMVRVLALYLIFISWSHFLGKNRIRDYCVSAFLTFGIFTSYLLIMNPERTGIYVPFGVASFCVIFVHFFIARKIFKSAAPKAKKEALNA